MVKIGSVDKLLEECGCTCFLEKEARELALINKITKLEFMMYNSTDENERAECKEAIDFLEKELASLNKNE